MIITKIKAVTARIKSVASMMPSMKEVEALCDALDLAVDVINGMECYDPHKKGFIFCLHCEKLKQIAEKVGAE